MFIHAFNIHTCVYHVYNFGHIYVAECIPQKIFPEFAGPVAWHMKMNRGGLVYASRLVVLILHSARTPGDGGAQGLRIHPYCLHVLTF